MLGINFPKLHYISQGSNHLEAIENACQAGCKWVQLRLKNASFQEYLDTAIVAKKICEKYDTLLTINDNPQVAFQAKADGLHLGKEDMSPSEARKTVEDMIIGGTANNWEDIVRLAKEKVDYIGLGPFAFTSTKEKLSPILGLKGYMELIQKMKLHHIEIPVLAIGGIELKDIPSLVNAGVWGVAVSGLITNSKDKKAVCQAIENCFNKK